MSILGAVLLGTGFIGATVAHVHRVNRKCERDYKREQRQKERNERRRQQLWDDERRKEIISPPMDYSDGITYSMLVRIIKTLINRQKKIISYDINESILKCVCRSQTGYTNWNFTIDFNDNGKITGQYSYSSENKDSTFPEYIAEKFKQEIEQCRRYKYYFENTYYQENKNRKHYSNGKMDNSSEEFRYYDTENNERKFDTDVKFCSNCGTKIIKKGAIFCYKCGSKIIYDDI